MQHERLTDFVSELLMVSLVYGAVVYASEDFEKFAEWLNDENAVFSMDDLVRAREWLMTHIETLLADNPIINEEGEIEARHTGLRQALPAQGVHGTAL